MSTDQRIMNGFRAINNIELRRQIFREQLEEPGIKLPTRQAVSTSHNSIDQEIMDAQEDVIFVYAKPGEDIIYLGTTKRVEIQLNSRIDDDWPVVYLETEFDERSPRKPQPKRRRLKPIDDDDRMDQDELMRWAKSFVISESQESKPRKKRAISEELPELDF